MSVEGERRNVWNLKIGSLEIAWERAVPFAVSPRLERFDVGCWEWVRHLKCRHLLDVPCGNALSGQISNVEATVRVDTVLAMKSSGQVRVVREKFTDGPRVAVDAHARPIHKFGPQASAAPNNPRVRGSLINNRLPFRFQ